MNVIIIQLSQYKCTRRPGAAIVFQVMILRLITRMSLTDPFYMRDQSAGVLTCRPNEIGALEWLRR